MNRAMTDILTHTACPVIKKVTDEYNSQHGKTCSQSIVGELPRWKLRTRWVSNFKRL